MSVKFGRRIDGIYFSGILLQLRNEWPSHERSASYKDGRVRGAEPEVVHKVEQVVVGICQRAHLIRVEHYDAAIFEHHDVERHIMGVGKHALVGCHSQTFLGKVLHNGRE